MAIRHTAYGCQHRRHRWFADVPGYAVVLLNNGRLDEDHRGGGDPVLHRSREDDNLRSGLKLECSAWEHCRDQQNLYL